MSPKSSAAHVPPPSRKAAKKIDWRLPAAGASVAAAVGLAWLLAPAIGGPKESPAEDEAPAPALPMPERAATPAQAAKVVKQAAAQARAERAAPREAEREGGTRGPAMPAWAAARSQEWEWPRHVSSPRQGDGASVDERRLVGWTAGAPAAKSFLYSLTVDRKEHRMFEEEIPDFEAKLRDDAEAERAAQARRAGGPAAAAAQAVQMSAAEIQKMFKDARRQELAAKVAGSHGRIVSARDVSDYHGDTVGRGLAEVTYADGTKAVVPFDPLVFDLKGRGVKTASRKVLFDLYGYGNQEKTQWMNDMEDGVGVLVFNANRTGASGKTGAEVFGDRTDLEGIGRPSGFNNGFEALHALVDKAVREDVIPKASADRRWLDAADLEALEKAYGLKMKVGGMNKPPVTLAKAGVAAIALSYEPALRTNDFDGQDNDLVVQPGAVFLRTDGTSGTYMNIWLKAKRGNLGLKTAKRP